MTKYTISQFDEFMNINVVTPDIESLVVKISLKETLPIYSSIVISILI